MRRFGPLWLIALVTAVLSVSPPAGATTTTTATTPTPATVAPATAVNVASAFGGHPARTLSNSGGWSWFEGPRATVDACELQVGSVATGATVDGPGRDGDIDVTTLDLSTGITRVDTLASGFRADDHNSPALLTLRSGKRLAMFTRHREDRQIVPLYRPAGVRHWTRLDALDQATSVTYSNLAMLANEGSGAGRLYDFYRGGDAPRVLVSDDQGVTWRDTGPLLDEGDNRPYVKYADDGAGRIDLVTTDGHPRERTTGTSIYHGYLAEGVLHTSAGASVGALGSGVPAASLTPIFLGDVDHRAWTQDVVQGGGGPVVAFSVRDLTDATVDTARNRYWYARWDGSAWQSQPIAFAGASLYAVEEFYTGGIAIDPADASHVVLSSNVDPATGAPLAPGPDGRVHFELFDGLTGDGGATWVFTPITSGSTVDNLRPVIPEPSPTARALVWMAGTYPSFRRYATAVRAIVIGGANGFCPAPAYEPGPYPVSGDFDADGRLDYLHYRPGGLSDTVFWGNGARTEVRIDGTYTPIPFRQAGAPDRDAILWSNPSRSSYLWVADGQRFTSTEWVVQRGSRPVIGDFNGDGVDDVLHYRPGAGLDRLDLSRGGGYQRSPVVINGSYRPLAGDVNADGVEDIVWYGPGSSPDSVWTFEPAGLPRAWSLRVGGTYQPSIGDLDGDGTADIYWGRADSSGFLWSFRPGARPSYTSTFVP